MKLNAAMDLFWKISPVGKERQEARERIYNECFKPSMGAKSIYEIKKIDIERVQSEIVSKYAPSTLAVVMSVLKSCLRHHDINIKFPKLPKIPKKSIQRVSEDQQKEIFKYLHPDYLAIVKFACLYGCRISEAINLKLSDFNLSTMTFVFSDRKNKRDNELPIIPEAEINLRQDQKVVSLDGYVFTVNGHKFSRQAVYRELQTAMKKAGFEPMPLKNFSRHSRACQLLESGQSTAIVARLLGDSEATVGQYYGEISSEKIRQVLSNVANAKQI